MRINKATDIHFILFIPHIIKMCQSIETTILEQVNNLLESLPTTIQIIDGLHVHYSCEVPKFL